MVILVRMQAGKAALVAEESAVSAANLARAARTQAALGAAMLAAQAYNQVQPLLASFIGVFADSSDCGALCQCLPSFSERMDRLSPVSQECAASKVLRVAKEESACRVT